MPETSFIAAFLHQLFNKTSKFKMPEALVLREIVKNKKDKYLQEADEMETRVGEGATKRFVFTEAGLYFEARKENKEEDREKEPSIELAKQLEAAGNAKEYGRSVRMTAESYQQEQNLLHRAELEEIVREIDQVRVIIEDLQAQREEIKKTLTMSSAIVLGREYYDFIYIYNSEAKNWQKCNVRSPFERHLQGAAILKEELYVFGYIKPNDKPLVKSYKLKGDGWYELAEMNEERSHTNKSTIVFNEEIWVIGGWNEKTGKLLKSVEKYNPGTDSWTLMAELNHARGWSAAVVIDNKIYVCGGLNKEMCCLKSVEVYDPDEDKWEIFCDLPFELCQHSALADGTNLIVIGGDKPGDEKSKDVFKKDISNPTNNWEHLPDLSHEHDRVIGALKTEEGLMVFSQYFAEMFDGKERRRRPGCSPTNAIFGYITIQLSKKDEELFLRKLCS